MTMEKDVLNELSPCTRRSWIDNTKILCEKSMLYGSVVMCKRCEGGN